MPSPRLATEGQIVVSGGFKQWSMTWDARRTLSLISSKPPCCCTTSKLLSDEQSGVTLSPFQKQQLNETSL